MLPSKSSKRYCLSTNSQEHSLFCLRWRSTRIFRARSQVQRAPSRCAGARVPALVFLLWTRLSTFSTTRSSLPEARYLLTAQANSDTCYSWKFPPKTSFHIRRNVQQRKRLDKNAVMRLVQEVCHRHSYICSKNMQIHGTIAEVFFRNVS